MDVYQPFSITDGVQVFDASGNLISGDLDRVANGQVVTTFFVPTDNNRTGSGTPDALNATLNLTATGSDGQVATTTFTDSLTSVFEGADASSSTDANAAAFTQSTHDWNQVYNDTQTTPFGNTSGAFGALLFLTDPINTNFNPATGTTGASDIILTGGSSKDGNDFSQWLWTTGSVQDKNDIEHAGGVAYIDPSNNHHLLYLMMDRYDNSGDASAGFWLTQNPNPLTLNPGGTISGAHSVGDILINIDFTGGGSTTTPNLYTWTASGLSNAATVPSGAASATVNPINANAPWPFYFKASAGPTSSTTFKPGEFIEIAVDLDAIFPNKDVCFAGFIAETRSSQSETSTLSDVAFGNLNNCREGDLKITKDDGLTQVTPGQTITYTIVASNIGTVTAFGAAVTDTFPSDLINVTWTSVASSGASGNDASGSGPINDTGLNMAPGSTVTYTVTGTVSPTAPNPGTLVNTAKIDPPPPNIFTDTNPNNNQATDTDTITGVPKFDITKTVDSITGGTADVAGDIITYKITLANTGNISLDGVTATDKVESYGATNATYVSGDTGNDSILGVGETWIYSANYTLTQADLDGKGGGDGKLDNLATGDTNQTDSKTASASVPLAYK